MRALPARRQLSLPLHIDGKSGRRDLSLLPSLKRRADRGHRPLHARHFRLHLLCETQGGAIINDIVFILKGLTDALIALFF